MKETAKDFFDRESSRYKEFILTRDFVSSLRGMIIPLLRGSVLDIGSGCVADFQDGPFDLYIAMDISLGMLMGLSEKGKARAVCGDATALPFGEGSFDVLIFRAVLHHLSPNGMPERGMNERMRQVFSEAKKLLRPDGRVLVVEPCLPLLLEGLEEMFSPLIRWIMRLLGLPYVFIFSSRRLSSLLREERWDSVQVRPVQGAGKKWDWIIPILGLPFLKIPRWLSPSKVYLIEAVKR